MHSKNEIDRKRTTPFLLKLFYRSGSLPRAEEFHPNALPSQHVQIYTWTSCTLRELSELLFNALPQLFPSPVTGTSLAFRILYPDPRVMDRGGPPRYMMKDIGHVVVHGDPTSREAISAPLGELNDEANKQLGDARFVIGDFVCVGIFPGGSDGAPGVIPREMRAENGRAAESRDGRDSEYGDRPNRNDSARPRGPPGGFRPRGPFSDARAPMPAGEWSRGEILPDDRRRLGGGGGGYGGGYGNGNR